MRVYKGSDQVNDGESHKKVSEAGDQGGEPIETDKLSMCSLNGVKGGE